MSQSWDNVASMHNHLLTVPLFLHEVSCIVSVFMIIIVHEMVACWKIDLINQYSTQNFLYRKGDSVVASRQQLGISMQQGVAHC